jgi:hypothetical protein
MKKFFQIFWRIGLFLIIAGWGALWATGMMDSIFAYRSPLRQTTPKKGEALYPPPTRKAVLVIIDALREDTSLNKDIMPNLDLLRQNGAWARMHSQPPSFSQPGYSTILTGAWPELNDSPVVNVDTKDIWQFTQDDLFSSAKRAGLKTAIGAFNWFDQLLPDEAVDAGFYTEKEDRQADLEVIQAAMPWLSSNDYQFILIHLDQVDYAGHHEGGPRDPRWDEAARRCDDLLEQVVAQLDLTRDTIMVISDHGQIDRGGHGGQDAITLVEPFVVTGQGIKPGHYTDIQMVDVAPTLAALLGSSLPASSQGHARIDLLSLNQEQNSVIAKAESAQQEQLVDTYRRAVLPGELSASSIEAIRNARLSSERLPRFILVTFLFGFAVFLIFKNWNKNILIGLIGSIIYILLFNIRFLLLDGRGYSLSTLEGVNQAILYFGSITITTLLITWLILLFLQKWYEQKPAIAFENSAVFFLMLIFALSVPVLFSFVLNGWKMTWHLPEFTSEMAAFINTLQIIFIAGGGILLSGLSAATCFFREKFKH